MKIVIAPDSFKGSLMATEVCDILEKACLMHFEKSEVIKVPIADGGEGTLDAILQNLDLETVSLSVTGPDFDPQPAVYGMKGDTAYIEMARTSGLGMSKIKKARKTTSCGFGEAILHAIRGGAKTLYLAIGGSATNDGGMGMLSALGVRFLDADGKELPGVGESLGKIHSVDVSGLCPEVQNTKCYIICDVENPLLGNTGATRVYGRQKGASDADLDFLEEGMKNYAEKAEQALGKTFSHLPGAGAAGGVGAALLGFLHATFCPGIDTVLDIIGFDKIVEKADLVITGEGKMDGQSAYGKAPVGVAKRSGGAPVVAIVGGIGEGYEAVYETGISTVYSVFSGAMTIEKAIEDAKPMMTNAADRMLRTIKIGMQIQK